MHTPDDPTPTAKRRQTCAHPGTVNAIKTYRKSNAKAIIIVIYTKARVLLEGLGEQVGFQL